MRFNWKQHPINCKQLHAVQELPSAYNHRYV